MTILQIEESASYSNDSLADVTGLVFLNKVAPIGSEVIVSFSAEQVASVLVPDLSVTGSSGSNHIVVVGGSVDLSGWQLQQWEERDRCELYGSDAADILIGSMGRDQINAGPGDNGRGGAGNDIILTSGNCLISGGAGDDVLYDNGGNNIINGGLGNDTLSHFLFFKSRADLVIDMTGGGLNLDLLSGSTFASIEAFGGLTGVGNDVFIGGAGADGIATNRGKDKLYGNAGDDFLKADAGRDLLEGGEGADVLRGEYGADKFQYLAPEEGGDKILDFSVGGDRDQLRFSGEGFGLERGGISAARFQMSADAVAQGAEVRFIYETDAAMLWFDADGDGAAAAVLLATLQSGALVDIGSFWIF